MEGNSGMGIRKIDPLAKGAIAIGFNIFATMDIKLDCRISNRERSSMAASWSLVDAATR